MTYKEYRNLKAGDYIYRNRHLTKVIDRYKVIEVRKNKDSYVVIIQKNDTEVYLNIWKSYKRYRINRDEYFKIMKNKEELEK